MKEIRRRGKFFAAALALGMVASAGCSGPTEDVRVTLCKNLTTAMQPASAAIEWTGGENTFRRPEYAVTSLNFKVTGDSGSMQSACYYAYEALEDTAITLADPLSAHANLPFKMTLDGQTLSDGELLKLVNAEQMRQGRQVIDKLEKGARDAAEKVRAGIGQ